jgi:hypothetical protein
MPAASPARSATRRMPSAGSTRRRSAGTATRARPRSSRRTRDTPIARRAMAHRSCTRLRRQSPVAPATRPSKRPRRPATSAARAATSRTPGAPRLRAQHAMRTRPRSRTRRSPAAARLAIALTAQAASPLHRRARPATLHPHWGRSTRRRDMPNAQPATGLPTRHRAGTEPRAPGHATWTGVHTSPTRPSARDATYSGGEPSSSGARCLRHFRILHERPCGRGRLPLDPGLREAPSRGHALCSRQKPRWRTPERRSR